MHYIFYDIDRDSTREAFIEDIEMNLNIKRN